jgi:hypothetical protein
VRSPFAQTSNVSWQVTVCRQVKGPAVNVVGAKPQPQYPPSAAAGEACDSTNAESIAAVTGIFTANPASK